MQVSVTEAKGRLTDLVRRAEEGDDIVLTRHGRAAVRLVPVEQRRDAASRRGLMEAVRHSAAGHVAAGPSAAHSQHDLYDEDGLPR